MEDDTSVDAITLLLKGQVLPHNTHWSGNPSNPCENSFAQRLVKAQEQASRRSRMRGSVSAPVLSERPPSSYGSTRSKRIRNNNSGMELATLKSGYDDKKKKPVKTEENRSLLDDW